jgi:putative oxidoreductase
MHIIISSIHKLETTALHGAERVGFLGPLIARLTLGVAFVSSGWGKIHNLNKVTEFFTELGIPAPHVQAVFVSWVELVCGALVLLGLATRLASIPLICTMIVALITAKAEEIAGVSDLVGTIELTYIALSLWLTVSGAGALSLDRVLARLRASASAPHGVPLSTSPS